jgi:hypothetical protein
MKINNSFAFFFLIPAFSLLTSSIFAQSIIEDVGYIKRVTNDNSGKFPFNDKTKPVFEKYFGVDIASGYTQKIENNPFLKDIFVFQPAAATPTVNEAYKSGPLEKIGNLDVTNFAFGMADFLIERAKTELNTAFFKRLNDALDDAYLKTLFPKTKKVLEVIGVEIYQYNHYLNALRTAFAEDLKALLDHLPAVIDLLKDKGVIKPNSEEYHLLHLLAEIGGWVQEKLHPGEILSRTAESSHLIAWGGSEKSEYKDVFSIVECSALFSESFRNTGNGQYWVGEDQFVQLKDSTTLKIYLGLVFEISKTLPYNNIKFNISGGKKTLTEVLNEIGIAWNTNKIPQIIEFLQQLRDGSRDAVLAIETLDKLKDELNKNTDISNRDKRAQLFDASLNVYKSFVNLLKVAYEIDKLPFPNANTFKVSPEAKNLVDLLQIGGDIGSQLLNGQYSGAVTNIAIILKYGIKTNELTPPFLKYGTFMANIVEAETPEDAKAAIEAIALPPGSYTIKRESACNIAFNGYIGAFYGQERIDGVADNGFNNIALTAPVGIAFSLGNIGKNCKNPWSFSLFAPIIDLGVIASYRLKTDNTSTQTNDLETLPTVKLKHIIAPGLFAEIGIKGTPLSLGFGGQFGPRLRNLDATANPADEIGDTYFRLGGSLKVDIPLLNLYNKPVK